MYKSWPRRLIRAENTKLHLAPNGKMWSLLFEQFDSAVPTTSYDLYCDGELVWDNLSVKHNGLCTDFTIVKDNIILAMNYPPMFFFLKPSIRAFSVMQVPDMTEEMKKLSLPFIGNYGLNPLLFQRNFVTGQIIVGMITNSMFLTVEWAPLIQEGGDPWVLTGQEELIPISHAPNKVGAVAHVTKRGTAFYSLEPFNTTHKYTEYMIDNPMFYNMGNARYKDLTGHPIQRIDFSGWNALFNLQQDSYVMKLDAEDIAKPAESWLAVEVDGTAVSLNTEFTVGANGGEIKLTALETLTDISVRCEQPILLDYNTSFYSSVIPIKLLWKNESIIIKYAPPIYDTYTNSAGRKDFFHITITAEVWKTDLGWSVPCCCNVGVCPLTDK